MPELTIVKALFGGKKALDKINSAALEANLPLFCKEGQFSKAYRITPAPRIAIKWKGLRPRPEATVYLLHVESNQELSVEL